MPTERPPAWLDRIPLPIFPRLTIQTLLVIAVLLLAFSSRLVILGERVMSHDEVNHVVYANDLAEGRGYRHDPMTHGPFQFHIVGLSYFLLGDSDFTSRLPAALFSIATVALVLFKFRRYLGRAGALIAGLLFVISPFMLFYGRYTRNDAFVAFYGVLLLYSVLRYIEKGETRSIYLFVLATVMHYITKETSYIYSAEILLFLGVYFIDRVSRRQWDNPDARRGFIGALMAAALMLLVALGVYLNGRLSGTAANEAGGSALLAGLSPLARTVLPLLVIGAVVAVVVALYFLLRGIGVTGIRAERSFDLLVVQVAMILPLLAALPIKLIGGNPLDYSNAGLGISLLMILTLLLLSAALGVWWNPRVWAISAALFFGIFIVFFTTFFTNGVGFFSGVMGSLGYWMEQQEVVRGGQPLYYYALVQVPFYEYLPALGTLLALGLAIKQRLFHSRAEKPFETLAVETESDLPAEAPENSSPPLPVMALLLYWSLMSMVAFSVAGERMPWLTVHIALPLLLCAGWSFGYLLETFDWTLLRERFKWLAMPAAGVFLLALFSALGSLLGSQPPFAGKTLAQLAATNRFLLVALIAAGSAVLLWRLARMWSGAQLARVAALALGAILLVLTVRTTVRANYVNYDTPLEYLVYAHAAAAPKQVMAQIDEISFRLTGGKDLAVAYDGDGLYPFWWYLRDYPNRVWYADNPTADLRNSTVVVSSEANASAVGGILGTDYYEFAYPRLWWPEESYDNLTLKRVADTLGSAEMRGALFKLWLDRDYSAYAAATKNSGMTLTNWGVISRMRVFIRKDAIDRMWDYGLANTPLTVQADPYEAGTIDLATDFATGGPGVEPGQFQAPRAIAAAPDGSLYVADSRNNRIQHIGAQGEVLHVWGRLGKLETGDAPGGSFNEPWGVAVSPDGAFVYVTDTWNNRVQKFTASGEFVSMWGTLGSADQLQSFWGPRGIAVDSSGRVYVADTGNKRIVIFDADGNYLAQYGGAGMEPGQFDEPVGVAVDLAGNLYITDTWNQRVQILSPLGDGLEFTPTANWEVSGWYGQSLENKPFIAVDSQQHVFVTDPEGGRVIEFDRSGEFIRTWGQPSETSAGIGIAAGIAVDARDTVWVSDAANNLLLHFTLPVP